jgi:phosphotransferase system HPr-like phosphotransfer protein
MKPMAVPSWICSCWAPGRGTRLTLTAHGSDATALIEALRALIENGFDEGE